MLKKKKTILKRLVIFSITLMFIFTAIQLSAVSTNSITDNLSIKPRCSFQKIDNFQPKKINNNLNLTTSISYRYFLYLLFH